MKGGRWNEARGDHDVAFPRRCLIRVARFERAIVFADARAGRRGDTPHPAAGHASFVDSRRRVVGVRRSGVDRRPDGGRRSREMAPPVRRKGSAGHADAKAETRQERGERAQLAEWFPPPTSWCGSVSACAHTAMLSAPLRPIKHLTEGAHVSSTSSPLCSLRRSAGSAERSAQPGGGPVCACASGSGCFGCNLSACPKFRVIVR